METLNPNPTSNPNSPNKRFKTETLTLESSIPPSLDKGKAPIIAENDDFCESPAKSGPESCGICLSEEGRNFRGLIDSCDHYYCFLCIIEWSKIESRCPLCRGRFSSIRRVRKDGSFIGSGSVRVPVRDQIYDPFGEPADPYAQAKCSVCNGTNDECLLLLCDLCDTASHTFCVGLGATIPEGDWYCRDCALLRAEQLDSEMDDNAVSSSVSPHADESSPPASISIFDIVRDPSKSTEPNSGTDRLLKLVSQHSTNFSSSAIASDQPNIAYARSVPGARGNLQPSVDMSSSARTLKNCRNVHRHINVLRENWGAFRTGSLSFSFAFSESLGNASQKKNVVGTSAETSCKLQSFSSTGSLQSKAVDNLHNATCDKDSYNVDRAWKLMNKAKTVKQTAKSKGTSKISQYKAIGLKVDKFVPKYKMSGTKGLTSSRLVKQNPTDKGCGRPAESSAMHQLPSFISPAASSSGSKHQKPCVPKLSMPGVVQTASKANIYHDRSYLASSKMLHRLSTHHDDGSASSASLLRPIAGTSDVSRPQLQGRKSSDVKHYGPLNLCTSSKVELRTSVQADICHDKIGLPSVGRGFNTSDERNGFACSTSSYEPVVSGYDASHVKLECKKMSACPVKVGAKITSKGSKDDEAKGEIQSLVKLNLKLLFKDKRLGVEAFKEIARLSTHTILASCGFEHRKIVRSLPTLLCHHGNETLQLHRSSIVPSSCKECFYNFVKNVVNSIMSEKMNDNEVAS